MRSIVMNSFVETNVQWKPRFNIKFMFLINIGNLLCSVFLLTIVLKLVPYTKSFDKHLNHFSTLIMFVMTIVYTILWLISLFLSLTTIPPEESDHAVEILYASLPSLVDGSSNISTFMN